MIVILILFQCKLLKISENQSEVKWKVKWKNGATKYKMRKIHYLKNPQNVEKSPPKVTSRPCVQESDRLNATSAGRVLFLRSRWEYTPLYTGNNKLN